MLKLDKISIGVGTGGLGGGLAPPPNTLFWQVYTYIKDLFFLLVKVFDNYSPPTFNLLPTPLINL